MKIKIIRSKFLEGLKAVQNIVAGKGSLAILQNVLLEARDGELKMTTTDLDISIKCSCECEVIEPGVTTLPVKLLSNSVAKVNEGPVEVEVDSHQRAKITAGSAKFKLTGMEEGEFPKLPQDEDSFAYVLQQATVREMLRKTSYAASQDDTRRTLKGVLMSFKDQKLTMVATDGRRLALVENEVEFPASAEKDIVLPSKAVQELQRSLSGEGEVSVIVQKSQICFKLEKLTIYSKLMDDAYPNYKQVIPAETAEKITIDRQLLLDALDRASVMTMDEAHSTKLIFEANKLTVTSAANDIGEARDEVAIKYAGEKIEIMFNPSYVMDPLKAIDDDEVTININNGHSPAVIKCSIPFLYVLMPLRIS
ncbi:MAG: DNA polymerase III subunit beta [Kiritimatiellae bacterium]|jgi:DNA polymerase-3 subunit beta|nr:DNA polymerase III subunit beta [Kiritimatiellia bacterium]